ncbi:MAG: hypothetical protein IK066_08660 [Kiritimatiellae bacterium]|nr:hypothetical protein [Kiritimatiellia bacterium]
MTLRYALGNGGCIEVSLPGCDAEGTIEDFHICRLGMKFLSASPLPEFMEYAFGMGLRGASPLQDAPPVEFRGIVVQSEREAGRGWRVAIHFSGVGEDVADRIDRYSALAHLRCAHCGGNLAADAPPKPASNDWKNTQNRVPIIGKSDKTGFQSLEKPAKPGSNHWKNGETGFQ